jgi:hypothetical protein
MDRYYFAVTSLPPLQFKVAPEISFKEFYDLMEMNLSPNDLEVFHRLLEPLDLYNIKALWLGVPIETQGTMSAKELEEELLVRDTLPPYLINFLEEYETSEDRLHYFAALYAGMYAQEFKGFLGWYFSFERDVRLVLTALRAKNTGRDIGKELQFEDFQDSKVAQILAQKDAPDYMPPMEYEDLKVLFVENSTDPRKLSEALLKYRFEKIGEWEAQENFSLDRLIAYAARLLILESIVQLSEEQTHGVMEELGRYG